MPTVLTGIFCPSLWTKPVTGEQSWLSPQVDAAQAAADVIFNPALIPLTKPSTDGFRGTFYPRRLNAPPISGIFNGGVNSFMYERIIRQLGTQRLDGQDFDLGEIREDKLISQTLWNGFNETRILAVAYSYPGSGVVVTSPLVGDSVRALAEFPLVFTVSLAGLPIFDVTVTITAVNQYGHVYDYSFNVRGTRFVAKEFKFFSDANWTEGLDMTSRFLTSIYEASETSEARQVCRAAPAREMSYEFVSTGKDFTTVLWGYLQGLACRRTYMPLFQDVAYVTQDWTGGKIYCDTTHKRFYAGKTVIIAPQNYARSFKEGTKNDTAIYYTATISSVESDGIYVTSSPIAEIPVNTALYPGIYSEIAVEANTVSTISGVRAIATVNINEVYGSQILPVTNAAYSPTLRFGHPLFPFEWNMTTPPKVSVSRDADVSKVGRYQTVRPKTGFSTNAVKGTVSVHTRAEWWDLAGFFGYIKGRYRPFWIKNPLNALQKGVYTLFDGANLLELDVLFLGGANNLYSTQALWLVGGDGTIQIAKIHGIRSTPVDGQFVLEVDPVAISDIKEVHQAFLVRSTTDDYKEHWIIPNAVVEVPLDLVELPAGYQ